MKRDLIFLKKRVAELSELLDMVDTNNERLFFVGVTFGKYMEYHSSRNEYKVDEDVLENAVLATDGELVDWFKETTITDFEQDMIASYLEKIQSRMTHMEEKEKEKLR